jgi:hypothetical protein
VVDLKADSFIFSGWEISMNKRIFTQSKSKNPNILIIKPSRKAIINLKIKIKSEFHSTNKPFIAIISKLNSLIRGWVNYYSISSHSSKSFRTLQNYIYQTWWIWAQKRHPKRPKKWLAKKYILERVVKRKATFSDIDLLSDVTKQIEGHTICALGDAAAWPIQGIIRHFRPYIEERIDNYKGDVV